MATWKVVKAQAREILGIKLTDADVDNVPLLATDAYGNFIPGPHGLPQVVMKGADGIAGTADDVLVEGNLAAPIDLANAVRTGHQFLNDIAHSCRPVRHVRRNRLHTRCRQHRNGAPPAPGTYDNELLDAHYIAGDGRVNENIGLTAVHAIFHSEHNRLVEQNEDGRRWRSRRRSAFLNEWVLTPTVGRRFRPTASAASTALQWNGERLFQAAKFGTEMQYQHLVFEEFARTVQPKIDPFFAPTQVYDINIDPAIVAEFAQRSIASAIRC